jgi:hypothetical protein
VRINANIPSGKLITQFLTFAVATVVFVSDKTSYSVVPGNGDEA